MAFDILFKKIEPASERHEGSQLARKVITKATLSSDETRSRVVARSWLNSHIQNWSSDVQRATKTRGLRDDSGNPIPMLVASGSPMTTSGQIKLTS